MEQDLASGVPGASRGRAALWIAACALILVGALRALALLHPLGLLGPDSLPLVLAARSGGWVGALATPLFGDWLPAPYYRPVLQASIALDQMLYGLAPFGYHASSVGIAAAACAMLLALARALGLGAVGGCVAVAFFWLHPVLGVVLPVPARRADSLCLLFTLAALVAQVRASATAARVAWPPALLCALAIGSKETGLVAPALCALAAACAPPLRGAGERVRAIARALPPLLGVALLLVGLRALVLGDPLGGRPVVVDGLFAALPAMVARVLAQSLSARAAFVDAAVPAIPLLVAAGAAAFALARSPSGLAGRAVAALALALGALLALAAGYALGAQLQPWYLLLPAAFAALGLGALAHALARAAAAGSALPRVVAVAGLVGIALAVGRVAADSYLVRGVPDWERAEQRAARYLDGLGRALANAAPGDRLEHAAPPAFAGGGRAAMRGVVVLAPYTVQAWAELVFPQREIRVVADGAAAAPRGGEIVVALHDPERSGAAATVATPTASSPAPTPSFVVIVADDLGYADLGFQGSREIATPNLDRLARQSVRFTDAYVTSPLCAPTRAALLTGRDPNRYGYTTATGTYAHQMRHDVGVPPDETLLPELLRRAGYATGAVGKWHLGVRPAYRPLRRGFQSFFGFLAGTHDYFDWGGGLYGPVFRDEQRAEGDTYLTFAFAHEASAFVRSHAGAPYFLYVAFHAVHGPLQAPPEHLEAYAGLEPEQRRAIAAMTTALDEGVGLVLDAIDASGRADQTLVWFLNDNGGLPPLASNAPLRGGKGDLLEGGIRVPMLLRWPAALAPGAYALPVSVLDVFPTLAAAANAPAPPRPLDGVDLLPHLRGAATTPPHEALHWRYERERAIRRGDLKLLEGDAGTALYDVAADPGETRDLSREQPDRVATLRSALDAWVRALPSAPPRVTSEVAERP